MSSFIIDEVFMLIYFCICLITIVYSLSGHVFVRLLYIAVKRENIFFYSFYLCVYTSVALWGA